MDCFAALAMTGRAAGRAAPKPPQPSRDGLAQLGYTRVRDYVEGKQDWIEAGLPVETAEAVR